MNLQNAFTVGSAPNLVVFCGFLPRTGLFQRFLGASLAVNGVAHEERELACFQRGKCQEEEIT